MQLNERTRWYLRIQNFVFVLLVIALLGAIAWLGERYSMEFDWTANKRNSISEESRQLLQSLDSPVEIVAYASENEALREGIRNLVKRYQRVKPDIELQFVNPDLAPEQARAEGVRFDGTLIVRYEGRREQLSAPTESDLSNALARLSRGGETWAVFVTGHGERKHDGNANYDLSLLAAELEKQGLQLQSLSLASNVIPDNTSLVVIASPQTQWLPVEIERLRNYLDNGGNLLWLTDPQGVASLDFLQEQLGVTVKPGVVVDPSAQLFGVNDPTIALVTDYPARGPTAGFQLLTLFPRAAGLVASEESAWRAMPLLRTLPNSWRETGELEGSVTFGENDEAGPVTIAFALEREIAAEEEQQRSQRVIVVGDGDFASNAFVGNQGNLDLAANLFNWAATEDALLNIRIKEVPDASLNLTRFAQLLIGAGFLFVLPLLLLAAGVAVFLRRRRR